MRSASRAIRVKILSVVRQIEQVKSSLGLMTEEHACNPGPRQSALMPPSWVRDHLSSSSLTSPASDDDLTLLLQAYFIFPLRQRADAVS